MIPEKLKRLQTTGEDALDKLGRCRDKRAKVVAWCGTGIETLSKYLFKHERAKLLSNIMTDTMQTNQPQSNQECRDFGERF